MRGWKKDRSPKIRYFSSFKVNVKIFNRGHPFTTIYPFSTNFKTSLYSYFRYDNNVSFENAVLMNNKKNKIK